MSEAGYQVTHIDQIPEPPVEKEEGGRTGTRCGSTSGSSRSGSTPTRRLEKASRRRARRGDTKHEELFTFDGERDVHGRRRDRGSPRRHLRLCARSGVDPLRGRARAGDDHPLPRRELPGEAFSVSDWEQKYDPAPAS